MTRRKRLTNNQVAALAIKGKRYSLPDPELSGHYVRVMPSGAKSYTAVARDPHGKQVWATLDSTDVVKIEDAREEARKAIKRIKAGLTAFEAPPAPPVTPDAFKSVAEDWLKRHVAKSKLRTQPEIERCLSKYVFPHWADRDFVGLKRSDVAKLLDRIEDNHGSRQADLVLGILSSISNWFATRDDDYVSPFVRRMQRHKASPRARILDDDELRAVWKEAEHAGTLGALIKTLLLTAQRRGAVLGMRWADIAEDGTWEIPKEERAKGNAGSLQLPAQALAIINALPRIADNPFVFASGRTDGAINSVSKAKRAFDKRCGVTGWRLHDLRRTSRSLLSRAGVPSDHAERVLGHSIRGVEGVYDRHDYAPEKAVALGKLAALVEEIVNDEPSGKVVKMKPKVRVNA